MRKSTPPFVTPFAILSIIVLIGTSNLVVNHVTHTREGAPARPTRVVNDQNRQPSNNSSVNRPSNDGQQKAPDNSSRSEPKNDSGASGSGESDSKRSANRSSGADEDNKGAANSTQSGNQTGSGNNHDSIQKQ